MTKKLDIRKLTLQMKMVHIEFLEQGRTVNQHCYLEILARLCEVIRWRIPELWPDVFILHHDSALAHDALAVWKFWPKINNEIGPFTVFGRFGPVQLLATPRTEDRFEGPQIFGYCRYSGTCNDHPAEHSRRGVPEMF
jgi:hypothetical protein